jgi:thiamine biosynthesis lipoprotein ApbE
MNSLSIRHPWAGAFLDLALEGPCPEAVLRREAGKAMDLARFVQRLMSPHEEDRDLSRLNNCSWIAPLRVHPWTYQALIKAVTLSRETEGAFDITVRPKTVPGGPAGRHQAFTGLTEAGRWEDIELLPDCNVRFRRPLRMSLREMMTGFAMDKAIDYLSSRREITRAALKADGEMRTCGEGPHPLPLAESKAGEPIAPPAIMLRPAVTTLPAWFARSPAGAHRAAPVIHPRTGKVMRSNYSVSVFSRTSMEAGALVRAVLLSPQTLWNRLLKMHDSIALILTTKGEQVLFPA